MNVVKVRATAIHKKEEAFYTVLFHLNKRFCGSFVQILSPITVLIYFNKAFSVSTLMFRMTE